MTSEIPRCYRALELEPGASLEQVKRAWRELVKVWHPDRFPNDAKMQRKAQERLKAINGAYEVLSQFLASENSASAKQTTSSAARVWDEGASPETKTGGTAPPVPPAAQNESKSPSPPKKSRARVIFLLVLAFGVLAYSVNLAIQYHAFTDQLRAVRGIHIGDSRDEVKYRLGFPPAVLGPVESFRIQHDGSVFKKVNDSLVQRVFTVFGADKDVNKMPSTTKVEDYSEWVYDEPSSNVSLTVEFNAAGLVESLNLYADRNTSHGWGPVAGISAGDSEEEVLSRGAPSQQNLDGVDKTIEYRGIGLVVTLTKGRAYKGKIQGPQDKAAVFWRFVRSVPRQGWYF